MAASNSRKLPVHSSFSRLAMTRGDSRDLSISDGLRRQASVARGKIAYTKLSPFRLPPADHPFDSDYDSNTAMWLVSAACLVYSPKEEAENVIKNLWGMPLFEFFDIAETDTQALAFANDDFIVVAFRGTESRDDWSTNLDHKQVPLNDLPQYSDIMVHRGFNTACTSVLPSIEKWVLEVGGKAANPNKFLYIGGHSLGGALSTLCYAHWTLRENPISVNGVVTIGQPRVGTPKFVQKMNEVGPCILQRIFNANDVVPTVPPSMKGYQHYGSPIYFNARGQLIRRPPRKVTRGDKTKAWVSGKSGISAHMKNFYLDLVKNYDTLIQKKAATAAVFKAVFTIHSAKDLKAADSNGLSDPFVIIQYHDTKHNSPVAPKTLNPVWNHEIAIPEVIQHDTVTIQVWDSDSSSGRAATDDFLGQIVLHLDDCLDEVEVEYDLLPRQGKKDVGIKGSLVISSHFFLLRGSAEIPTARAEIILHGAREIKAADAGGTSDPYARISCGSVAKKTNIISKTINPDWEYSFIVPSVSPGEVMYIDLWDYDRSSKDDFLGRATIEFDDTFTDVEAAEFPLEARVGKKTDKDIFGSIFLSAKFTVNPADGMKIAQGTCYIHGARDLKAADSNGKSDPYVVADIGVPGTPGAINFKSPKIEKTLNPSWEVSFAIPKIVAGTECSFLVWDHDRIGSHDFLGQVILKFSSFVDINKEWYSLAARPGKKDRGISGDICLSFKFNPIA